MQDLHMIWQQSLNYFSTNKSQAILTCKEKERKRLSKLVCNYARNQKKFERGNASFFSAVIKCNFTLILQQVVCVIELKCKWCLKCIQVLTFSRTILYLERTMLSSQGNET